MPIINTYPIGITGAIASGKSTAIDLLKADLDLSIVCADQISREITKKKTVIKKIGEYFGEDSIVNKQINRAVIRNKITESREAKKWLEDYLHPVINREIKKQVKESTTKVTLVEIPLLGPYNIKHYKYIKKVVVIEAEQEVRIKRLIERDGKSRQQSVAFINLQMSSQERNKIADYVIDNTDKSVEDLKLELIDIINQQAA
jgi:dephospho-CoA kinase